jgi:hypothetical protein
MMLAFVLVVVVNGEPLADNAIFFRDVKRCNQFAHWISTGSYGIKGMLWLTVFPVACPQMCRRLTNDR